LRNEFYFGKVTFDSGKSEHLFQFCHFIHKNYLKLFFQALLCIKLCLFPTLYIIYKIAKNSVTDPGQDSTFSFNKPNRFAILFAVEDIHRTYRCFYREKALQVFRSYYVHFTIYKIKYMKYDSSHFFTCPTVLTYVNYGVRSLKYIWAPCAQLYSLAESPQTQPLPPHLGSYTRPLLISQDRRHLFATLRSNPQPILIITDPQLHNSV
jgi:hypothetical protein